MALVIAAAGAVLALAGCAPAGGSRAEAGGQSSSQVGRVNLDRCKVLEAHLYRCPGIEEPLCDPDFARPQVPCLAVTRNGTLLAEPSD